VLAVFAAWCALSLRADLSSMSFAPLWNSWDVILLAVMFSLLNYMLRVVRWRWYLGLLGYSVTLGFSALTYVAGFAFTLSPGKLGELVRARYYTDMGIPLRDVAAAFCVERLMDVLALVALAALMLTAFPHYEGVIWAAAVVSAASLALLTVVPWDAIAHFFGSSPRIPGVLARYCVGAANYVVGSRSLLRPRAMSFGFLIGLAAWALEGFGLGVLSSIFTPGRIGVLVAIGIYGVAVLVGALSFLPGGLGSTEAVMTALLARQGYSIAAALLITLACRMVTLWLGVCLGWIAVFILRHRSRQGAIAP
jgi:uncharacterized membrane protein YbhN (UPF0104 family)